MAEHALGLASVTRGVARLQDDIGMICARCRLQHGFEEQARLARKGSSCPEDVAVDGLEQLRLRLLHRFCQKVHVVGVLTHAAPHFPERVRLLATERLSEYETQVAT